MKYTFKTAPWPHQVAGFKFVMKELLATGSSGLQVPMRWGKSKLAIDCASALHMKTGLRRVLVVTTTSGLGVWEKEIPKHCPFPVIVIGYDGEVVHHSKDAALQPVDPVGLIFFVIHHSLLFGRDFDWGESAHEWRPVPSEAIEVFDPEMIVMDESHKIGDPSSMQSKMSYRYGQRAKYRMTLTGTMFHRGVPLVFGQFKFLSPETFGTSVEAYRREYVRYGGYGNYQIVGFQNLGKLSTKVKSKIFVQEYIAHTEPVVVTTPVRMEECKDVYTTMERESVVTVGTDVIIAPIILTKHLRCSQIAGGWLKTEDGRYLSVGNEKARALEDKLTLMFEEGIDKVVIGAMFIPELLDIARAAKKAGYRFVALHGGVPRGVARDTRIAAFQEAEVPTVFVAQIQAAAEAIDLSDAQHLIYYSMPDSYVLYDQFGSRIEKYRETRTLSYDHLIMQNSRDVVKWFAMRLKKDVSTLLLENPTLVEDLTRKDDSVYHVDHARNRQ